MTVDIIIPAYKAHDTINRALASCAMQKLNDGDSYSVTIVNDCDPTGDYHYIVDYWAEQMNIQTIDRPENGGPGLARQTGVEETDGDYIVFMDADDCLCTPYALRTLFDAILDADMAMGQFAEEAPDGSVLVHDKNFIWMHGKILNRRFIERHNIHFNATRANEDVGYCNVIRNMTDRIKYVPQVVYCWNNRGNSLVRSDRTKYACGHGWRGFMENMAWCAEELRARQVNKALIRDFAVEAYVKMYFQFMEALVNLPSERAENEKKLKETYERMLQPYVLDGAVPNSYLSQKFVQTQNEGFNAVPAMTFRDFNALTGLQRDMEGV